ncbi:MAG TPA: UDP-N-acetylmuramoyl-L-alanine--D-glutamate ligase [Gaiellaceae bacterium]|nr:UDP-N-acetylmuramoyl-L-alanine--D-glutamate ligase [Gaiellaceae bacterium]
MRALVYGLGRSGRAAAERLAERGDEVVEVDRSLGNELDLSLLDGVDVLVKSPGVPGERPLVTVARERRIPVWSEVELGYRLLPGGARLVGVTGTNGKTTTAELLGAIFREAGRSVAVAGNVGTPLASVREADWVVCELSSFQLEDVHELACDVAVLLNIEPDHLDRHGSLEDYRAAKLRIFERARVAVVPRGLTAAPLPSHRVTMVTRCEIAFGADDPLPAEPLLRGAHNRENAAAATAAARAAGLGDDAIAAALASFPGVAHRLELVAEAGGVRFVNDSKATNVAAARRALAAYAGEPVHLILGGSLKGEDFGPLAEAVGPNVRSVHLIGEASGRLAAVLPGHDDGTLERAVEHAAGLARPGDVVLLSPACASYDQFENFEQRGEEFRRLSRSLRR